MIGYKAFNMNLTCRDMQYEIGKEYVFEGKPIACKQGFHFCETIAECYQFYPMSCSTRICKIEASGDIVKDGLKYITNKIKIIEEITKENIKKGNKGYNNSGYRNEGHYNSGECNNGAYNSGDMNNGNNNSGNRNIGSFNSGAINIGQGNSGDNNIGNLNSGNENIGYKNSGNHNTGDCNSGEWNSGNYNSGLFNTEMKPTMKMFDKESSWTYSDWYKSQAKRIMDRCPNNYTQFVFVEDMTEEEKENHPEYKTIGGFIETVKITKEERQAWWDNLGEKDKNEIKALPNFDEKKFCECVGIEHI